MARTVIARNKTPQKVWIFCTERSVKECRGCGRPCDYDVGAFHYPRGKKRLLQRFCRGCFHTILATMERWEKEYGREQVFAGSPPAWCKLGPWDGLDNECPHTPLIRSAREDTSTASRLVYADWLDEQGLNWESTYQRLAAADAEFVLRDDYKGKSFLIHWLLRSRPTSPTTLSDPLGTVAETVNGEEGCPEPREYPWYALTVALPGQPSPTWWYQVDRLWDEPAAWTIRRPRWFRNYSDLSHTRCLLEAKMQKHKRERLFLDSVVHPLLDRIVAGEKLACLVRTTKNVSHGKDLEDYLRSYRSGKENVFDGSEEAATVAANAESGI